MATSITITRWRCDTDPGDVKRRQQSIVDHFVTWPPPEGLSLVLAHASIDGRFGFSTFETRDPDL